MLVQSVTADLIKLKVCTGVLSVCVEKSLLFPPAA